jgi:hypothetical protein
MLVRRPPRLRAMVKNSSSSDSSLPLHEVLEAEFAALHGELPADYPDSTESETRLKAFYAAVHKEKHAALCISGGGIRSATFGLGILQGLARCGLLDKFHYLSTVSGGGYIGSWLSAWIKNDPDGIRGVVDELKSRPDSTLNPEPQPIRHLREFSNYLAPRTGLTSVDFWTLITTFIRNMFLNWLVLISWLAAFMMIPRLYLGIINLQPNWTIWTDSVQQRWDIGLGLLLIIAFALIAIAMAYAIIDVPATGNARLPQRRFLLYRQLPLFLAALILTAWWAVFCNLHGGDAFDHVDGLLKFLLFFAGSYICGGLLGAAVLSWRTKRFWFGHLAASLRRVVTILLATALAGFCLWAMATRMFLDPKPKQLEFALKRDCDAIWTAISKPWIKKTITIPAGSEGLITQIHDGNYTVRFTKPASVDGVLARVLHKDLDALDVKVKPEHEIPDQVRRLTVQKDPAAVDVTAKSLIKVPERLPQPAPGGNALNYVCFAPILILAVLLLVNFFFTGLASWVSEDEDREWWGRSAAWLLITIFGWSLINIIVLWGAQWIAGTTANQLQVFLGDVKATSGAKGLVGTFGAVTGLAGALLALRSKLSKTLGQKATFQWLLVAVAVVFFVLLSVIISWALLVIGSQPWVQDTTKRLLGATPWQGRRLFVVSFLAGSIALVGIVMGFFINANKFSLHATYRDRLIRAYLAASRPADTRKPNLFTGFDPEDNFELHELWPKEPKKPLHVLNGTINLVKGQQLAWQERNAESFTMSPLHCGCLWFGYRPSAKYGNGITLGTALAISGAAANPNMGYHSSPVVGFLMTLFNVRLGWWLGNPGPPGDKTWRREGPRYSVGPLFSEAMGNTTDSYKYVNLSDGGHFENLGLYEMVLRRCHYIIVSDGGQDPECSFADLGEAVRKIRIDFGIPIEFEPMTIYPRSAINALKRAGQKGHNCAIGHIRYSVVDGDTAPDGVIVYIKPACYGDEPRDIYEYFKRNKTFPHESTSDQFFSESQFESYRMLGAYTMEKLCTDCGGDFRCFVRDILKRHLDIEAPDWLAELFDAQGNRKKGRKRLIRTCVRAICGKLSA